MSDGTLHRVRVLSYEQGMRDLIIKRGLDPASRRDDRLFIIACDDTYASIMLLLEAGEIHVVPAWPELLSRTCP